MQLNNRPLNEETINGEDVANGPLLSISKNILENVLAIGTLLYIKKDIQRHTLSQPILYISKKISSPNTIPSFYTRNGWEPIITINAITVPANQIINSITITKQEEQNHLAEFSLRLYPATYNLHNYQAAAITISIRQAGVVTRLFTGIVDIPVVNTIDEKITLKCVSDRRTLLNNLATLVPYIGYYDKTVIGGDLDTYDLINSRLKTIPYSLDFDSYNNYSLTSWQPAASPNFSLGSSSIYRRTPSITIESSSKIINQVDLTLSYGYQRCHHVQTRYEWNHPYAPFDPANGTGGICPFLHSAPSMPTRAMIQSAAEGTGWPTVNNNYHFGKQFLSGNYQCDGYWTSWSTVETSTFTAGQTDANGNPILDPSGNQYMRSVNKVVSDHTNTYTMNALWDATKRFTQNIKEVYTISVKAPQSISLYGTLPSTENYSITNPNQFVNWENYKAYTTPPTGVTLVESGGNYFFNGDDSRESLFVNMYVTALNKAKTMILKTHRDTSIVYQSPISPTLELKHTVALTGKWINGKGKCKLIKHVMNVSNGDEGEAYTEVTLLQYRGVGTVGESILQPPAPPADTYLGTDHQINLQTHLGIDPSTPGSEKWNGYVGNMQVIQQVPNAPGSGVLGSTYNYTRTNYTTSFIVDAPVIDSLLRDERTLNETGVVYNINIPSDSTTYQTYG